MPCFLCLLWEMLLCSWEFSTVVASWSCFVWGLYSSLTQLLDPTVAYATQLSHLDLSQNAGKANMANFLEEWGRYWQSVVAHNVGLKAQINPWLPVLCISVGVNILQTEISHADFTCVFKQCLMSDHLIGHTDTTERTAAFRVRWHGG